MTEEKDVIEKITTLTSTRQIIFDALSRFESYVKSYKHDSIIYELQTRFDKAQILWSEFSVVQGDLEVLDKGNDHSDFRGKFEDSFFKYTGIAKGILDTHFLSISQQNNIQSHSVASINANLPKLKLPEFYGSYDKWLQFADTYKSLIHNSSSLSKIEKFWYLKSCIKGEAANIFSSLELSEANYDKAWESLCERYENKKVIIQAHLKTIFDSQVITKESHVLLRGLIDNLNQNLRALESLGLPINYWDTIIIYHATSKLDFSSRKEWEDFSIRLESDTPTFKDFTSFINKRCQVLENLISTKYISTPKVLKSQSSTFISTGNSFCILCKKNHAIYYCNDFLKANPQERLTKIRKLRACTNCLRQGHMSKDCDSNYSCKKCTGRHNTLLHLSGSTSSDRQVQPNEQNTSSSNTQNGSSSEVSNNSQSLSVTNTCFKKSYVLLSTANVLVFDVFGKPHLCRAILDNCSQSNFITKVLFDKLKLTSNTISHSVEGFGSSVTKIFRSAEINLKSNINSFKLNNISCLITDKITKPLPEVSFNSENLEIPSNITLADKHFNQTGPVDMLIGATHFWSLICVGQIVLPNKTTVLQKTTLGWIISGTIPSLSLRSLVCNFYCHIMV